MVANFHRAVTALRFCYRVTVGRGDAPDMIPVARHHEKKRAVLTATKCQSASKKQPRFASKMDFLFLSSCVRPG